MWKNSRDLHICQANCLAALRGNAIFNVMDLTSGFDNISMCEEDKKFTVFTMPLGQYEFNHLPQGLCNSPSSFMQLMRSIFGDQNFLTLLCCLDDFLVVAPNEEEALKKLEMFFGRVPTG